MGTDQEPVEKPVEKAIETKSDSVRQEYTFASDVKLKECKYCRVMIPQKAKICPNCKMALKKYTFLKAMALILALAVIGAGGYCLSAYGGLLPDSAVPAWIAQNRQETPVVSVTTVETAETAAGAKTVEPTEVATATETADAAVMAVTEKTKEVTGSKEVTEVKESVDSDGVKEETKTSTQSDNVKGEDDAQDKVVTEDKSSVGDKSDAEKEDVEEDKSAVTGDGKVNDTEDSDDSDDEGTAKTINKDNAGTEEEPEESRPMVSTKDIDEDEAAFRAECEPRKYKSLLRDEEYLDTAVLVTEVEVVGQTDGGLFDENIYYLCRGKANDINCYYIIRDDRKEDTTLILEGDIITVYGQLFGTCRIPANLIETRPTVPAISMVSFDLLEE